MTTWTHSPNEESSTWRYHTSQICRDVSGNVYSTIKIGNQEWMAENLKTTKYNDGTAIAFVDDEDADVDVWENLTTGAYSRGGPDGTDADDDYEDTYGYLYNWYAVDTGKLAPEGWHVPTDTELTTLTDYLGSDAGSKLAGRADLWEDGDLENNAEFGTSGFNHLPGGYRYHWNGNYRRMVLSGYFWSSTEYDDTDAWYRDQPYYNSGINRYSRHKRSGYSVRCVRGTTTWNTLWGGLWNLGSLIAWEDLDKHNWEDWN